MVDADLQKFGQQTGSVGNAAPEIGSQGQMEGGREVGRLYRIAMEKKGIWQGIPIEYARAQTEFPSREGWNHEWKR